MFRRVPELAGLILIMIGVTYGIRPYNGHPMGWLSPFVLTELCVGVGLLGLFAIWRLGRRIGGPLAGLIALALLATCPLYYGHMFINPKDSPFAVMMAVTPLSLSQRKSRRNSERRMASLGRLANSTSSVSSTTRLAPMESIA